MENFSVDEIVEDPTNDKNWVRWMKEHYKKQGFSEEHVAMILMLQLDIQKYLIGQMDSEVNI